MHVATLRWVLLFTLTFTGGLTMAGERVLDFTMKTIDGDEQALKDYEGDDVELKTFAGNVVMIVNVASKCGFTKQYDGLQELYSRYKDKGFVILGFPANNFMGQEPGTNEEIKEFCTTKFNVDFPMFAKISVKGDDMAPLYRFLTEKETNPTFGGKITWNFNKFLIGRDGHVINRFATRKKPLDEDVVRAIEAALNTPE